VGVYVWGGKGKEDACVCMFMMHYVREYADAFTCSIIMMNILGLVAFHTGYAGSNGLVLTPT